MFSSVVELVVGALRDGLWVFHWVEIFARNADGGFILRDARFARPQDEVFFKPHTEEGAVSARLEVPSIPCNDLLTTGYRPVNLGSRFSRKAFNPSWKSSLRNIPAR